MGMIEVVRKDQLQAGRATPGTFRKQAFETENMVLSQTQLDPGVVGGWHHHGERDLYGLMIEGTLKLEYGRGGKESVEVVPGDFFHIPPGLVHRDINPEKSRRLVVVAIVIGPGPAVVNVTGPRQE